MAKLSELLSDKSMENLLDKIIDSQLAQEGIIFPETQEEIDLILNKGKFEVIKSPRMNEEK